MGKTDSIKERRVDVYLDTLDRKERWKEFADQEGDSLSKFVQKAVEYTIERGGPDYAELGESSQHIQDLEQEIVELKKQLKQKDIVIDKLESDLRGYRLQPFTKAEFEGTRRYDHELIELLQTAETATGEEIRQRLGVDPTQVEQMQAIDNQLKQLEAYGLVRSTSRGWRWTE